MPKWGPKTDLLGSCSTGPYIGPYGVFFFGAAYSPHYSLREEKAGYSPKEEGVDGRLGLKITGGVAPWPVGHGTCASGNLRTFFGKHLYQLRITLNGTRPSSSAGPEPAAPCGLSHGGS